MRNVWIFPERLSKPFHKRRRCFAAEGKRESGITGKGKPLPALARGDTNNTTKADAAVAGCVVMAVRRQQMVAFVVTPRGTPQHTFGASGFIQIFAPLPHVAAQIVDAIHIGLK